MFHCGEQDLRTSSSRITGKFVLNDGTVVEGFSFGAAVPPAERRSHDLATNANLTQSRATPSPFSLAPTGISGR
jgi:hypothetical protein